MNLNKVKKTALIIYLSLITIISMGIWSISDMATNYKISSILHIIIYLTILIIYLLAAESLEKTNNTLIISGLTMIGFAFMSIIPIYIMSFFEEILNKYQWTWILFMVFWGLNIYYGIKIIKIAFRKFKKTESIGVTMKNNKNKEQTPKTNFIRLI